MLLKNEDSSIDPQNGNFFSIRNWSVTNLCPLFLYILKNRQYSNQLLVKPIRSAMR